MATSAIAALAAAIHPTFGVFVGVTGLGRRAFDHRYCFGFSRHLIMRHLKKLKPFLQSLF